MLYPIQLELLSPIRQDAHLNIHRVNRNVVRSNSDMIREWANDNPVKKFLIFFITIWILLILFCYFYYS